MENMADKIPISFDSKIKKLRIELPKYSFSHSLSKSPDFVGRKQILQKLKSLIKDTTNETGVYLVTGNRGVGKTSLVNEVIKKTSLQFNDRDEKNIKKYVKPLKGNKEIGEDIVEEYDKFSRLYLRINFGHNLTEKDILRLIARTLKTE